MSAKPTGARPPTDPVQVEGLRFLTAFTKLVRLFTLYPPTHPAIRSGAAEAVRAVQAVLAEAPRFSVSSAGGILLLQGEPPRDVPRIIAGLVRTLSARGIDSILFERGLVPVEVEEVARIAAMDPEEALEDGRLRTSLLSSLTHVRVNEVKFKMVHGDAEEEAGDAAADASAGFSESQAIRYLLDRAASREGTGAGGAGEGPGGGPGGGSGEGPGGAGDGGESSGVFGRADALSLDDSIFGRIAERLGLLQIEGLSEGERVDVAEANMGRLASELGRVSGDVREFRENFLRAIFRMSPEQQQRIFGTVFNDESEVRIDRLLLNLSIRQRAEFARRQLTAEGISAEDFRESMKGLIAHEGEVVDLAEQIGTEVDLAALSFQDKAGLVSRLVRAVEGGMVDALGPARALKSRGVVVLAEPQEEDARVVREALNQAGYTVRHATDGGGLMEILRRDDPDMIVMEMRLPVLHGLDILARLKRDPELRDRQLPVIVVTAHEAFRSDFEVQTYPRIRFLGKPVRREELIAAAETFLPGERAEDILRDDLVKARAVQAKLLPDEVPEIPGFELGTYYSACFDVGGDYYDVLPLDERRTAFMVADVSGKGVSGAMVMVMVRSLLRMMGPRGLEPRETMIALNRHLSGDLRPGMFVTALYMVLDHEKRVVRVAGAGHNPAVVWREAEGTAGLMKPSGMALGIMDGPIFEGAIREVELSLSPGDRVLTYTDGIVEAMDRDRREFGAEPLIDLVARHARESSNAVIERVIEAVKRHEGTAPRHDDITIVTFRCL